MMGPVSQTNFCQPFRRASLRLPEAFASRNQRHGYILQRVNPGQKERNLQTNPDSTVANPRSLFLEKKPQENLRAVYIPFRGPIKLPDDVQQGALSRPRLANNRQHFSLPYPEGQIL